MVTHTNDDIKLSSVPVIKHDWYLIWLRDSPGGS